MTQRNYCCAPAAFATTGFDLDKRQLSFASFLVPK